MPQPCSIRSAIAVEGVSFRYRSDQSGQSGRAWTVDAVSFAAEPGEILGIVGPNGSGKSSLLKLLAGLLRPALGAIQVAGQSIDRLEPRALAKMVAVVPQEFTQAFPFTVAETVLMGRFPRRRQGWWNLGMGDESADDLLVAHRAMVDTDVVAFADRLVTDLSGGERQRVMLARALAQESTVLLLDEPMAFLDINHQIDLCGLIRRLNRERALTVVIVSHDLNVASQLCDRLVMLKEGQVFQVGTPAETIREEVLQMVYGCEVVVDAHPHSGLPRVTMPSVSSRV
ncbi:MAG: ABC transporter ATP-binding protein [Nitrospira sp.]|nr:ABC transporter ATP-binding protein [Nitrospira sp.]